MKKKYAIVSFLLILSMLAALLTGCGSGTSAETASVSETEVQASSASETAEAPEAPAEEESEPVEEVPEEPSVVEEAPVEEPAGIQYTEIALPLVDELTTFTMFCSGVAPSVTAVLPNGYNDDGALAMQYLESITNVEIDFQAVDGFVMAEQFSLMMASGDWPDMISGIEALYTGGSAAAYADEIIYELSDYVEYLPNYMALLDAYPEFNADAYTDAGEILNVYGFQDEAIVETGGGIRQDYLDALGLEMPTTYDELYEVGMAIKEAYNTSATFYFTSALNPSLGFSAGFNLPNFDITRSDNSFYQVDGQVQCALVADDLKEMLTMLKKWTDDGLLMADWYTQQGGSTAEAVIYSGDCAVWWGTLINLAKYNNVAEIEGFTAVALPNLVQEDGQVNHMTSASNTTGAAICFTTNCDEERLPIILSYMDYLFTEEGQLLVNYGIEGESYEFDENGEPHYAEKVHSYADGASTFTVLLAPYTASDGILPSFYDGDRAVTAKFDEANANSVEVYTNDGSDDAYVLPTLSLNTDEQEIVSQYLVDCETHAATCLVKFITGEMDLDTEWDSYVETMNELGLDQVIQAKQSAYDRYLSR